MKRLIMIFLILIGTIAPGHAFKCQWKLVEGLYQGGVIYLKYRNTCTGEVFIDEIVSPYLAY